jgi:hypothetical protein
MSHDQTFFSAPAVHYAGSQVGISFLVMGPHFRGVTNPIHIPFNSLYRDLIRKRQRLFLTSEIKNAHKFEVGTFFFLPYMRLTR